MADQQNVFIRINTTANTRGINQTQRALAGLNATGTATQARLNSIGAANNNVTNSVNKSTHAFSRQQNMMRRVQSLFGSFSKFLKKGFMLILKGVLIETAAYAAALSSVNLLLKSGASIVKAYNATLTGLGVASANAAAGVATMVAIFTQAMRQFAAAQSSASYGGSFAGASQALRSMQTDSQLAVFGLQALNSAFASASRNAKITGASIASIRGLSDFAVASGDMEKGINAAANLVTLLQSGKGAGSSEVLQAATELGPQFEKAFKKATSSGKKSSKELLAMFASGELSQAAGISGTADNVRGTLMGQLKTFGSEFQVLFADIGQSFIGPTQRSFDQITRIVRRTIVQMSAQLNMFAQGPFQNVVVGAIDKLGTFTAKIVNEYLPRTQEVLNAIGSWWTKTSASTKNLFTRLEIFLKRYSEASTEINRFFGGIFRVIGQEFSRSFGHFANLIIDNKDNFQDFGVALQDLSRDIFEFGRAIRGAFFEALPAINQIVDAIGSLVGAVTALVNALSALGPTGALAALGGLGFGMKAFGARNSIGGTSGFLRKNKNFAVAGLAAIPALSPELGGAGDFISAALLGGFAGKQLGAKALDKYNKMGTSSTSTRTAKFASNRLFPFANASAARMTGAGAVAATGAVGTNMATNFVEGKYGNDAATIGTGILAGAATGAAAGAILAGPTAGLSIAVAAVIGGLIGGINGWMKSGEAKKEAKKIGEQFAGDYGNEVTKLLQTGNIREAEKGIADFASTVEEVSEKVARSSEFREKAEETFEKRLKTLEPAIKMFNTNLNDLMKVTGKTEQEIIAVAQAAEIDLSSNLLTLQEILAETGLAVGRFGQDFNNALYSAFGEAVANIQQTARILDAPRVINEEAMAFREKSLAGAVTDEDRERLLTGVFEQSQLLFSDDPLKAARFIEQTLGSAEKPGEVFTTANSVLYGMQGDVFGGGGEAMRAAGMGSVESMLRQLAVENIVSAVTQGKGTIDQKAIENAVRGMDFDQLAGIGDAVREEGFLNGRFTDIYGKFNATGAENAITELLDLQKGSLSIQQSDSSKIADAVQGVGLILDPLKTAIDLFNTNIKDLIDAVKTGDTFSPRRNLVSTMSKHNSFDGMIAGKRSVTSSLRNTGLGSPSSDHAVGLAYDLTGQNLGMYQTAVRTGGGYAEFHGAAGSRHLHVVPGDAPMGDRATPVLAGRTTSASSYSSADSYTINVYPSDGADPSEIAEEVMNRIKREQRSGRERN